MNLDLRPIQADCPLNLSKPSRTPRSEALVSPGKHPCTIATASPTPLPPSNWCAGATSSPPSPGTRNQTKLGHCFGNRGGGSG